MKTLCLLLLLLLTAPSTRAADDLAVVSGDTAYLFGKPEVVIPADVSSITVSPNHKYLLAIRDTPTDRPLEKVLALASPPAPEVCAVYLFSARRRRAVSLYRTTPDANFAYYSANIAWLANGETALITLDHGSKLPAEPAASDAAPPNAPRVEYSRTLLLVNAAWESVRIVSNAEHQNSPAFAHIYAAPTRSEAALLEHPASDIPYDVRLVSTTGGVTEPIPLDGAAFVYWAKWKDDGSLFSGRAGFQDAKTGERSAKYFLLNRATRTVTWQKEKPDWFGDVNPPDPPRENAFPIRLRAAPGATTAGTLTRRAPAVIAEAVTGGDSVLLASEGSALDILGTPAAPLALYTTADALMMAPIYSVPRADYVTAARQRVAANAKQIATALQMWQEDNPQAALPPDVAGAIAGDGKFLKRDDPFHDPHTDAWAFILLTGNVPDATGRVALFRLHTTVGDCIYYRRDEPGSAPKENPVWQSKP